MPSQDYSAPLYFHTDPGGWPCLSLMLPYKRHDHHAIALAQLIQETVAAYADKHHLNPYLKADHGIRERTEREPSGAEPAHEGDGGVPLADIGAAPSLPERPLV